MEAINPCKGINLTVLGKKKKNAPVYHGGGGVGAGEGRVCTYTTAVYLSL